MRISCNVFEPPRRLYNASMQYRTEENSSSMNKRGWLPLLVQQWSSPTRIIRWANAAPTLAERWQMAGCQGSDHRTPNDQNNIGPTLARESSRRQYILLGQRLPDKACLLQWRSQGGGQGGHGPPQTFGKCFFSAMN